MMLDSMHISRAKLYWYIVLGALYVSAFQMLIRGVLKQELPQLEFVFILSSKIFLFLVPLIFINFTKFDRRFIYPLILLFYLLLLLPVVEYNDPYVFLQGLKNFVLPLFYIPILIYLHNKDAKYFDKLLNHYIVISLLYAAVLFFEVLSYYWPSSLYFYFADMSTLPGGERYFGRPLGAFLNIQTQGIVFALSSIYCFLSKRYFLFSILSLALIYSSNKTWMVAFVFSMGLALMLPEQRKKFGFVGLLALGGILFVSFGLVIYYFTYFKVGAADGAGLMYNQFSNAKVLLHGLIPRGFYLEGDVHLPDFLHNNEIPVLYMLVQMGPIGLLLWLISLYRPLFSIKLVKYLDTRNGILLVCSMFGLLHTHGLTLVFNMTFVLVLSIQLSYQFKQST